MDRVITATDCTTYKEFLDTLYLIIVNTLPFLQGIKTSGAQNEGTSGIIRSEYMHVRKYSRH